MKMNILLTLLLTLSLAQQNVNVAQEDKGQVLADVCDLDTSFLYYDRCISKQCLTDKINRLFLMDQQSTSEQGRLSLNVQNSVDYINDGSEGIYQVTISYPDIAQDELISDPVNCLNYTVYMIANEYEINPSRKFKNSCCIAPEWPQTTYNFEHDLAQIKFNITQSDLDTRQCLKFTAEGYVQWKCYFELAFQLKGHTQVSYFICMEVCMQTGLVSSTAPTINFERVLQVQQCPPSGNCTLIICVGSEVVFCSDNKCTSTGSSPFQTLYINQPFYVTHRITDQSFKDGWNIIDGSVAYQSTNFTLKMNTEEVDIEQSGPGFNLYKLYVPIVADNILLTAKGSLSQVNSLQTDKRALQEGSGQNVTKNMVYSDLTLGKIGDTLSKLQSTSNSQVLQYLFYCIIAFLILL